MGLVVLAVMLLASCYPKKNLNYFSADTRDSSHTLIDRNFEAKIQPGDKLSIIVTALNPASAQPYNLTLTPSTGSTTSVSNNLGGYTVDKNGIILFPQLGAIKVMGLTKTQLRDTLLTQLTPFLTNPVVTIEYLNFRVTVLGEVGKQGVITVPDGKLTILEALGQAGDIAIYGRRENVLVIREREGKREFGHLNLLSNAIFTSPYFQLQQNDVVYVEMTDKKPMAADVTVTRNLGLLSVIATIISTLTILIINVVR